MIALRGLYAITPESLCDDALVAACSQALAGGTVYLQYRAKLKNPAQRLREASLLRDLCQANNAQFIVNDDLALARQLGCGLHVGEHDCGVSEARQILGAGVIIGASCYNSLENAERAATQGASYLAFGAFYPSFTKTNARQASFDVLSHARAFGLPVVAIGGITLSTAPSLIAAGADLIAVVSALFEPPQQVTQKALAFTQCFN